MHPRHRPVVEAQFGVAQSQVVQRKARRLGIGRRLMDQAREFARNTGAIRLELTTERSNTTAQALYRACGYARDDVFYKFILTVDARA